MEASDPPFGRNNQSRTHEGIQANFALAMPAVTVILPTCRPPEFLNRAVQSVLRQTFADYELVVVDNHPAHLRVAGTSLHNPWLRHKQLRLLERPDLKNAAALRNAGLAIAEGEWVSFLDDDDEYHPTKLEKQWTKAVKRKSSAGLCQLQFCLPFRRRVRGGREGEMGGDELLLSFPGMMALFHARTPEVVFDERLDSGEDIHYFQRLVKHFKIAHVFNVPEPLVNVHVQPNSHVNLNGNGGWRAAEMVLNDFGSMYSPVAQRVFRLRARLGYLKLQRGGITEMIRISSALIQERQLRELRLILNAFCFKVQCVRSLLIA
ncbi:MAG: glycosyltransferase family 2 protein [Verrucomicrobiota bacterium]